MKVAFFAGCSTNYIFPNVGKSAVEVLNANGVDVVIPKNQACCGAPVFMHGDVKSATTLAEANVEAFSKYDDIDAIVTVCGTCGEQWIKKFPEMLKGHKLEQTAKDYKDKVYDITTFLTKVVKYDPADLGPVNRTVTLHDPCHLKRGMGVFEEPREILNSIPGLKLVEMKDADRCCGGAGSFSLTHFDLSMQIHKTKSDAVAKSGAEVILAGCGSCLMQFADGNEQIKSDIPLMHTIEVIAESYRNKGKK